MEVNAQTVKQIVLARYTKDYHVWEVRECTGPYNSHARMVDPAFLFIGTSRIAVKHSTPDHTATSNLTFP